MQPQTTAPAAFGEVGRHRPFAVVSPGFEQVVSPAEHLTGMHRSDESPRAPFAAVELDLTDGPDPVGEVSVGLLTPEGDGVLVTLDAARHRVRIVVHRDGQAIKVASVRTRAKHVRRLAFVLCENQVTALADRGRGWRAMVTEHGKVRALLDLRKPDELARHAYAWGVSGGEVQVDRVRAGVFGLTGIRDLHLVQHADGTPYERDGLLYLTATCAGMGFFRQGHWGVFTLDPTRPESLTQVAHLFSRRDGRVLGDHAGQIVIDDDPPAGSPACIVAVSSWGDFTPQRGVHVRHTRTSTDVLHGVHVLETERLELPTTESTWDPALTRVADRWYVAYVVSPSQDPFRFWPALAVGSPGGSYDRVEPVGDNPALQQCEGPIIARLDEQWRVLASDGHARHYPVYDLRMQRVGTLDAPYGTNIPHPQLVRPASGAAHGRELMLTFDGTAWNERRLGYGTHGDLIVMERPRERDHTGSAHESVRGRVPPPSTATGSDDAADPDPLDQLEDA